MKPLSALVLLAAAAAALHGNTVTLSIDHLPATFENGNYGQPGATYNGFASATIDGISNQMLLCSDAADSTPVPSGDMVYDVSTLGGFNPLQYVHFTGPNMVANYDEAAVLLWQLWNYVTANGSAASGDTITDYQYAIWNIFDPYDATTNPNGIAVNGTQAALQNTAVGMVDNDGVMLSSDVYPYVTIYTPDPNGGSVGNQEFLEFSTPEPGSMFLMIGGGLIGAAAIARKKLRKRPE